MLAERSQIQFDALVEYVTRSFSADLGRHSLHVDASGLRENGRFILGGRGRRRGDIDRNASGGIDLD